MRQARRLLEAIGTKGRELGYMILLQPSLATLAGYGLGTGMCAVLIALAKSTLPEFRSRCRIAAARTSPGRPP